MQRGLKRHGVITDHISIRTSSYQSGVHGEQGTVAIYAANYITSEMKETDRILVVDDLQESGKTYLAIKKYFQAKAVERDMVCPDIRLAVGLRKVGKSNFDPDYHVVDVAGNDWIVLPHEVSDFAHIPATDPLMRALFPDTWDTLHKLESGQTVNVNVTGRSIESPEAL